MASPPHLAPTVPRRAGGRSRRRTRTRRRPCSGPRYGVDVSRSMSSRSAAAWSSKGKNPRSAPVISRSSSSDTPATPHLVCCITTTVSTPSTWLDSARLRSTSSVTRPPALRMTWASPRCRPERGEHVDAGVHARHDGEPPQRPRVAGVGAGRGVALVGRRIRSIRPWRRHLNRGAPHAVNRTAASRDVRPPA